MLDHSHRTSAGFCSTAPAPAYIRRGHRPAQVALPPLLDHGPLRSAVSAAHADTESDERAGSGLFTWLRLKMTF